VTRPPKRDDLTEAARTLRDVLDAFPNEDETPADRVVRRRVEGAVAAAELAAGMDPPRISDSEHDRGLQDTDD
jgi:hypothetical protein